MRKNIATPVGQQLGQQLARFAEVEVAKGKSDRRCGTCAFRQGDHLANGSPETLMTALKCVIERHPFWCHAKDEPCGGWLLLRSEKGEKVEVDWDYIDGNDLPPTE